MMWMVTNLYQVRQSIYNFKDMNQSNKTWTTHNSDTVTAPKYSKDDDIRYTQLHVLRNYKALTYINYICRKYK